MKISVLIVARNGVEHLDRLLPSIQSQKFDDATLEVILLDNASADGTADWVEKNHPWVTLARSGENLKYVRGNNMAYEKASGDVILCLNQDTILAPGFISAAIKAFERFPDASALAVNVISPNVMAMGEFMDSRVEDMPIRKFWLTSAGYAAYGPAERNSHPVNFVSGCGFYIKKSALKPGEPLFDPRLEAYAEDTELSLRLAERGGSILFVPGAALFHNQSWAGRSGLEGLVKTFKVTRNRLFALAIHSAPFSFAARYPLFLAGVPLKALHLRLSALTTLFAFLGGVAVALALAPLFPYWLWISFREQRGDRRWL